MKVDVDVRKFQLTWWEKHCLVVKFGFGVVVGKERCQRMMTYEGKGREGPGSCRSRERPSWQVKTTTAFRGERDLRYTLNIIEF